MYTYIKQSLPKYYAIFEQPLSSEEYNNIGYSWQDYLDNKWVMLSFDQVMFKHNHPKASVREVWNMQMDIDPPTPERTLEDAKREKIETIRLYDQSDNVNSFNVQFQSGDVVSTWFTPEERANYKNSIDSAKLVGQTEVSLYIEDTLVVLSTQAAKLILAQIQLYADQCYIITKQHISAVESLDTIEAVDNFDHTVGYPQHLLFAL